MRDNNKDTMYFQKYIVDSVNRYKRGEGDLNSGLVVPNRVAPYRAFLISGFVSRIKAKYSLGLPVDELYEDTIVVIELVYQNSKHERKFIGPGAEILDQYSLETYDEFLWILSLGYLLNVPAQQFKKIVDIIDTDQVQDKLFEFIISAKLPDRKKLKQESYKYGWKLFEKLKEAVESENKKDAEFLVKSFLEKDWYKEHKQAGWYNTHKNKHDIYSGYWCFESAAIVAILSLDDSTFEDNEYYPKHFVEHFRSHHEAG